MTIKELIEELQTYPQDQKVLVDGYEYGYDELNLKIVNVAYRPSAWWNGDFVEYTNQSLGPTVPELALIIARIRKTS